MATRYCDHTCYGAYATTPTWTVPQEGDGLALAPSTTAGTAFISFSGIPTSGTISVCGVSVSTTSVLSAASADASANQLATNINATATTVASGVSSSTPQLRNLVFARGPSGGAPSGTTQIMFRVGAVGLNYSFPNTNCQITTTMNNVSSTATDQRFEGGVSGAYGWFFNYNATIWPQAIAQLGYGVWAAQQPLAGTIQAGDVVNIRAKNLTYTITNTSFTATVAAIGTKASPVVMIVDDGTLWPADGSTPVLKFTSSYSSNVSYAISHNGLSFVHLKAKKYSSGQRNLVFEASSSSSGLSNVIVHYGGNVRFENIDILGIGVHGRGAIYAGVSAGGAGTCSSFYGCRVTHAQPATTGPDYHIKSQLNATMRVDFIECEFVLTAAAVPWDFCAIQSTADCGMTFTACKMTGWVTGSKIHAIKSSYASAADFIMYFKNCDLGNLNNWSPISGTATLSKQPYDFGIQGLTITNTYGNRDFMIDQPNGAFSWNSAQSYPLLAGTLIDTTDKWSMRCVPSTNAPNLGPLSPAIGPAISKINTLADGIRTLTIEFVLEKTYSWTKKDFSVLIEYMDSTNERKTIDTFDPLSGAFTASTAAWTPLVDDGGTDRVTYVEGATLYHNRYKFTVTTPTAIKSGTEINIYPRLHTAASDVTKGLFIDPEIGVV